jgi:hypothetical protein
VNSARDGLPDLFGRSHFVYSTPLSMCTWYAPRMYLSIGKSRFFYRITY